jgi:hypothetical protein
LFCFPFYLFIYFNGYTHHRTRALNTRACTRHLQPGLRTWYEQAIEAYKKSEELAPNATIKAIEHSYLAGTLAPAFLYIKNILFLFLI